MRSLLVWLGGILLIGAWFLGCGSPPSPSPGFRVVVLGLDGIDPDLVRQWLDRLPNIRQLAEGGAFTDLKTVTPPQSAVAWASFATGRDPQYHSLFDAIERDPAQYRAVPGFGRLEAPWVLLGALPVRGPRLLPAILADPYWKVLDESGIATVNLRAPLDLPPRPLEYGRTLTGLGVPDSRGTWGTHYYLASDLSSWDLLGSDWAGVQLKLELREGRARAEVEGPRHENSEGRSSVPIEFELDSERSSVTIRVQGQEQVVQESAWSDWFRFEFPMGGWSSQKGASRFFVLETFPELRLYLMPIGPDPSEPAFAISSPGSFSAQLADRHGRFKTLGDSAENWGLNQERIDEAIFLEDLNRELDFWEKVLLDELERDEAAVYSLFLEAPDAASHLLYRLIDTSHPRYDARDAERYGDSLAQIYQRADSLIGRVQEKLRPEDLLLIVSDHGFHSWEKDFNANAWLVENGYQRLEDPAPEAATDAWETLFTGGAPPPAADWTRTEAYAVGFAGIYVNLKGREASGIVEPGDDYRDLVEKIRGELLQFLDPDTGERVVSSAQTRAEIYGETAPGGAPDIVYGLREGYRASWQTALGETQENVLVANLKKWSGDHASSNASETAGLLISNRPISRQDAALVDIAPTLYRLFKVTAPPPVDGRDLFPANP